MKRFLSIFACLMLLVAMIFTVAACGPKDEGKGDGEQTACTEHEYTAKVTKEATCGAEGEKTFTCTKCGATKTEPIAPTGQHTVVADEAVPAKCGVAGKTPGSHCSVCEKVIKAQEEDPALEHNYVDNRCEHCNGWDPSVTFDVYVFDAADLEIITDAEKGKKNGQIETKGTADFFKVYYGAKTRVDESAKTFVDEYTSVNRFNPGGKSYVNHAEEGTANVIEFTTTKAATVKIWWVCGGYVDEANTIARQVGIYNAEGTIVVQSEINDENTPDTKSDGIKNELVISELTLAEAGTFFAGNVGNTNYIYRIEVSYN